MLKNILIILSSCLMVATVGLGVQHALKSSLFVLSKVEIRRANSVDTFPYTDEDLIHLAGLAVGSVGLFELDLKKISDRMLAKDWIAGVHLQKRFPNTLGMELQVREPKAILQVEKNKFYYVDRNGEVFAPVVFLNTSDFAILFGFNKLDSLEKTEKIKSALHLIEQWESSELSRSALVSSVAWDQARGFRILISYSMQAHKSELVAKNRTMIDMGHEIDDSVSEKISRLSDVIEYLSEKSIAVRQVWADVGKKVVVKIVSGS